MKKLLSVLLSIIIISSVSGCSSSDSSPFEKKVDYKKIAKDLNEKNMDSILHAVDGYSNIRQSSVIFTSSPKNKNERKVDTNKVVFEGVYNTFSNIALGKGITNFKTSIENNENKEEKIKEETSKEYKVRYSKNQFINDETNKPLNLQFMLDKLQGIEKVKPKDYTYGLDVPASVFYELNEHEFKEIINDNLKINYDKLKRATILIDMQGEHEKLYIKKITISIQWEKWDSNRKKIDYELDNSAEFNSNNLKAKEDYRKMENWRK